MYKKRDQHMKKFICEDSFWELFPDAEIAVLVMDNILPTAEISDEKKEAAKALLNKGNSIAKKWLTSDTISKNEVVAIWREAYRKFKNKKGARCAIENLLKRVLKDNPVGSIVPSVDVTNYIALKYAMPIGIENIDSFVGNFYLRVTEGDDDFLPIGEEEQDPTLPGELCYMDDYGAVCRNWNWRDGQRTAANDDTPHCVAIMECIDPSRSADLHSAFEELAEITKDILGADVIRVDYATKDHPEVLLED